jgi:hypothetical protein
MLPNDWIMRVEDHTSFSKDAGEENNDWVEYQAWLKEGNEPDPLPTDGPYVPADE